MVQSKLCHVFFLYRTLKPLCKTLQHMQKQWTQKMFLELVDRSPYPCRGNAIIAANVAWDYFSRQFIFPRRYSSVVAKNRIVEVIYQAWEAVFHHQMHEILRRELKIRCAVEYFRQTSRCFIWWWNTVLNAWYYISNKMILEGEEKDAKMSSFTSDFQTLIKH